MNTFDRLVGRLTRRFKDIPTVEEEDVEEWMEASFNEHGYAVNDTIPNELSSLVMLYAEATGASGIAMRTAHFFSFVDKDESVDKSMIAGEYRRLATELWRNYRRKKEETSTSRPGSSAMSYMTRLDRP